MITRGCRCCGARLRTPPRDPAWARWTGELEARLADRIEVAPLPGSEIELTLRGPFEIHERFSALFLPWPACDDGLDEHPHTLDRVRLLDLAPLADLGDEVSSYGLLRARIGARVLAVHSLESISEGDGPSDRPPWHEPGCRAFTRLIEIPQGAIVSFSMEGDVSGAWWLKRDERGWRLVLEEDDAGLHVGWAYAGGHRLDDDELAWLAALSGSV